MAPVPFNLDSWDSTRHIFSQIRLRRARARKSGYKISRKWVWITLGYLKAVSSSPFKRVLICCTKRTCSFFCVSAANLISEDFPVNALPHTMTPWLCVLMAFSRLVVFSRKRLLTSTWAADAERRMRRRTFSHCCSLPNLKIVASRVSLSSTFWSNPKICFHSVLHIA